MFDKDSQDLMNEALDQAADTLRAVNQRQDLFDEVAKSIRLMYEALIRAGFTESAALEIASRQGGVKTK